MCYKLPEAAKQECSLETIDKKLSELRVDMEVKIGAVAQEVETKQDAQIKKWTDMFKKEKEERAQQPVEEVVTKIIEESKQRMDSDHMEREKRKKNIVLSDLEESTAESGEERIEEDKVNALALLGIAEEDVEFMKRAGAPRTPNPEIDGDIPRPRPLLITVRTQEIAQALHNNGRGRKFEDPGADEDKHHWCNPDLIQADRRANYLARQQRSRRRETDGDAGRRARRGSFLVRNQR